MGADSIGSRVCSGISMAACIRMIKHVKAEKSAEDNPCSGQEYFTGLGQGGLGRQIEKERTERNGRQGQQHSMKDSWRSAKRFYPEERKCNERNGIAMPP